MYVNRLVLFTSFILIFIADADAWQAGIGFKRVLPPRNLTYTSNSPTYTKWTTITSNTPSWSGHAVTSWSISPALPAGLSFNTSTGVITGTPTSSIYSASHTVTAANAGGSTTRSLTISVTLSPYTWMGTTSNVWSTGSNWFGGAAPSTNTHVAIFDNECTQCNANITGAATARSIQMKNNYTGTITQVAGAGNTLNLGTNDANNFGGFVIDAGTFVGGNANIRADYLELNAGSFTSTSAELRLGFNNAHGVNSAYGFDVAAGATYAHANGTLYLDSQTSSLGERTCGTINLDQVVVLYNFAVDCRDVDADDSYDSSKFNITGVSSTFQVMNQLHFYDGWTKDGTIEFYGTDVDFYCDSAAAPNICAGVLKQNFEGQGDESTQLVFKGSSAQTYTFQDGASGPTFRIENANGVTPAGGSGTFTISALNVVTGAFTAPSSTLQLIGRTNIHYQDNTTGITVAAAGSFVHNSGTVIIGGSSNYSDARDMMRFTLATNAITFNNLTLNTGNTTGSTGRELRQVRIPSAATITVLGNYTAIDGRLTRLSGSNPLLIIRGDYTRQCANFTTHNSCADEDAQLNKRFDTAGTDIFNTNPGDTESWSSTYTFNPGAGNTITINSGVMNLRAPDAHIVVSSGTLHIAAGGGVVLGGNLTNNAAITCVAGEFIYYEGTLSGTPGGGNDPSCYRTTPVDGIPAALNWVNFSGTSAAQTFSGLDNSARLQISVAHVVGTPTMEYKINGGGNGGWTTIAVGSPATWTVMNGHFLEFRVTGTPTHSGTFTIRNLSDSSNIIDTVTGTVP
jgi:hypothetical protein